jgi:hypothetical protein
MHHISYAFFMETPLLYQLTLYQFVYVISTLEYIFISTWMVDEISKCNIAKYFVSYFVNFFLNFISQSFEVSEISGC